MQTCAFTTAKSERPITSRRRERGAAMVEGAIVISVLTLGLMAVIFFRDVYVKELQIARLARAGALAHSMAGCEGQQPLDWLGPKDRDKYTVATNAPPTSQPAQGQNVSQSASAPGGSHAGNLVGGLSNGPTNDGKGVANPITDSRVSGNAQVSKPGAVPLSHKTVFKAPLTSQSFVSCGDKVRDGQFDEILDTIKAELKTFL